MTSLQPHGMAMLVFTVIVFAIYIRDKFPIETVSIGILAVLPLAFTFFPMQVGGHTVDALRFFEGFANPALVAICALMIVGQGLVVTGALEPAARRLAVWVARSPKLALLAVLVGSGSVSGVVNDTPVVVLLIPLLLAAAHQAKISAGGMLLPMNYSVLIGGMATTIGTSTNLIVVGLAASLGLAPMGLFDFFPLVAMAAVPALAYLWLVTPMLLSKVETPNEHLIDDVFDAEIHIAEGSQFVGKELREAIASEGHNLHVIDLLRDGRPMAKLSTRILKAGDRLIVRETAKRLKQVESILDAQLHQVELDTAQDGEAPTENVASALVAQILVTQESPLVDRSVKQARLAEHYDVIVVGVRPSKGTTFWKRAGLADRPVMTGDILLVEGTEEAIREAQRDGVGILLDERFALPRQDKAPVALVTMACVVILAATKLLPIAMAAMCGAAVLVLSRCLSWKDVAQSMSTKVVLLVAASLALGDALQITGATVWLAQGLAQLTQGMAAIWVLALLMGLMGLVTNFVSNNAAAAIGTPLGFSLAHAMGVPPEPFVMAVMFGCNLCYLTPMAYQTNLLVMNAGGYRFSDFVKVGTPLFVIMWVGLTLALGARYSLM